MRSTPVRSLTRACPPLLSRASKGASASQWPSRPHHLSLSPSLRALPVRPLVLSIRDPPLLQTPLPTLLPPPLALTMLIIFGGNE